MSPRLWLRLIALALSLFGVTEFHNAWLRALARRRGGRTGAAAIPHSPVIPNAQRRAIAGRARASQASDPEARYVDFFPGEVGPPFGLGSFFFIKPSRCC